MNILSKENRKSLASSVTSSLTGKKKSDEDNKREWVQLPVLIIPGIASSGLYVEKSGLDPAYEGQRVWMNAAFLAKSRLQQGVLNQAEIQAEKLKNSVNSLTDTVTAGLTTNNNNSKKKDGDKSSSNNNNNINNNVEPVEGFTEVETATQVRSAWLHHMSLASNMIDERPGNQVRPYEGMKAVEYLTSDTISQTASWAHAYVAKYLKTLGYKKGKSLDAAPYDWRLPPKAMEERDQYFTNTLKRIERMYQENGDLPVVLLCHSMGSKVGHYLLQFAKRRKGQEWVDKHVHTYMPVGAPHCGVSMAVRAGVTGKGLSDEVDMLLEGDDEGLVLYRSWGSGAWLMPRHLPEHVVPSVIVRKEAELALKVVSSIQVGPLFSDREKLPKQLRLTLQFRGNIIAHTAYVPLQVKTKNHKVGETVDATVKFEETFYMAVPHLENYDHLGNLYLYLEEPAAYVDQNATGMRKTFKQATSWAPVKAVKKQVGHVLREASKLRGSAWRVAVCEAPQRLRISQFTGDKLELDLEVPMCGSLGNNKSQGSRKIYNDDGEVEAADDDSVSSSESEEGTKPNMKQKLGLIRIKAGYRPPPKVDFEKEAKTPVAATVPGKTPSIPIVCKNNKTQRDPLNVDFEVWDGHDLFHNDGFCDPIWKLLDKYYERDPIGPKTRSAMDAPPVKRVRAIYGINLNTEVSAVYRHRPVVVVGDDMADSRYVLDTKARFPDAGDEMVQGNPWAKKHLGDYKMDKGKILETPKTVQVVPGESKKKRCSGDGTVPYWNLSHCLSWKEKIEDVTVDELDKAEHRGILADARFHALLKQYCVVRDPRASAMLSMKREGKAALKNGKSSLQDSLGSLEVKVSK